MILTLTANPSVDRTATLTTALVRGSVLRADSVSSQAGGKGVNISRAATQAGVQTLAVLPAADTDPFVGDLRRDGIACVPTRSAGPVRTNLTMTEPDGTTTKVNTPGPTVDDQVLAALGAELVGQAPHATWTVLAGSLPPGAPASWYADLVLALRGTGTKVAVDTSDAPLDALTQALPACAPDLMKPNGHELADLVRGLGGSVEGDLESDPDAVAAAAQTLIDLGVGAVLATLGGAGAVLVTGEGAWHASPPPVTVVSTVGAGDSSLFGYLLADLQGADPSERLRHAVAWGSAAAGLPGTTIPGPEQPRPELVTVRELRLTAKD